MGTRDELVAVLSERYARSDRLERGRILDEFVEVTGFHRKHAMRVLRGGRPDRRSGPRPGRRVYDEAVRQALIVIWEASDRICGKRLRPLIPILVESMDLGAMRPRPVPWTGRRCATGCTVTMDWDLKDWAMRRAATARHPDCRLRSRRRSRHGSGRARTWSVTAWYGGAVSTCSDGSRPSLRLPCTRRRSADCCGGSSSRESNRVRIIQRRMLRHRTFLKRLRWPGSGGDPGHGGP